MASGERAKLAAATARMEILRMISPESSEYVPIRHRPGDAMPAAFSRERRQQNRPASRKFHSVRRVSGQKGTLARLINRKPIFRRSEEHTSELQSLMRISYAVFCLKKQKYCNKHIDTNIT